MQSERNRTLDRFDTRTMRTGNECIAVCRASVSDFTFVAHATNIGADAPMPERQSACRYR
jgi:hypothetical protein